MSFQDFVDFVLGRNIDPRALVKQVKGVFIKEIKITRNAIAKIQKRNVVLQKRADFVQEQTNKQIDALQVGANKYIDKTQKQVNDGVNALKELDTFLAKLEDLAYGKL